MLYIFIGAVAGYVSARMYKCKQQVPLTLSLQHPYLFSLFSLSEFHSHTRALARIFAIGGALCIINNLGGLVNNGCGQLHVREQNKSN